MGTPLDNAIGLYLTGIRDGQPRIALERHVGDRYTQHSTYVRDGREGFIEFFDDFVVREPERDIRIVRALEDGPHVFLHVEQRLGDTTWVTADFFDTDEAGRIVEHWDVISPFVAENPAGRSSIDGPTEIVDLHLTEQNKQVVRDLLFAGLGREGNPHRLPEFIDENQYLQHSADVGDGLAPFLHLAAAPDRPLNYEELVLIVGQGNFVATLSRATWHDRTLDAEYAQVDLFRLENGKVVEHWDAVEQVLPREQWVNSGKF